MKGIMQEALLRWQLNGKPQQAMLYDGQDDEALLRGHMITAGLAVPGDNLTVTRQGDTWQVSTPGAIARKALEELQPLDSRCSIRMAELNALCDQVMALDNSAGLHSILLSDGDKTVIGRDVGRHNALDKAVGKAVQCGLRLENAVLCSSGRLSLEMFSKAAYAGIPILSTRKQIGSLCIEYAERMNIAVCRTGSEPACFSAQWRIL